VVTLVAIGIAKEANAQEDAVNTGDGLKTKAALPMFKNILERQRKKRPMRAIVFVNKVLNGCREGQDTITKLDNTRVGV